MTLGPQIWFRTGIPKKATSPKARQMKMVRNIVFLILKTLPMMAKRIKGTSTRNELEMIRGACSLKLIGVRDSALKIRAGKPIFKTKLLMTLDQFSVLNLVRLKIAAAKIIINNGRIARKIVNIFGFY